MSAIHKATFLVTVETQGPRGYADEPDPVMAQDVVKGIVHHLFSHWNYVKAVVVTQPPMGNGRPRVYRHSASEGHQAREVTVE